MSDEIPSTLSQRRPYAIVNLDNSTEPGSHWIAVSHVGPRKLLVYDSFGARHTIPSCIMKLYPRSIATDPDAEQGLKETNCGARAMAWLLMDAIFPNESWFI